MAKRSVSCVAGYWANGSCRRGTGNLQFAGLRNLLLILVVHKNSRDGICTHLRRNKRHLIGILGSGAYIKVVGIIPYLLDGAVTCRELALKFDVVTHAIFLAEGFHHASALCLLKAGKGKVSEVEATLVNHQREHMTAGRQLHLQQSVQRLPLAGTTRLGHSHILGEVVQFVKTVFCQVETAVGIR